MKYLFVVLLCFIEIIVIAMLSNWNTIAGIVGVVLSVVTNVYLFMSIGDDYD